MAEKYVFLRRLKVLFAPVRPSPRLTEVKFTVTQQGSDIDTRGG